MRRMIVSLLVLGVGLSIALHRPANVKASVSAGSVLGYRAAHHNNYGVNNDNGMINHSVERLPGPNTYLGNGTLAHQRMREAGVGWVRHWISWEVVEGSNGDFHWDVYDHDINAAIEQGMNVYVTLQGAPAWAHGGKQTYHWGQCDAGVPNAAVWSSQPPDCGSLSSQNPYAPFDPGMGNGQSYYWKRFVTEAVRRYGDRVKYWGFWNEPDNQWFWPEWAEPPYHSRAQQLVAKVIKPGREAALAANPSVVIVGPEDTSPASLEAFLGLEQNGIPAFGVPPYGRLFDVISIHVYDSTGLAVTMDNFKAVIDNYPRREVWLTETNGDNGIAPALEHFFVRGWLSKIFIFGMRGVCGGLALLDDNKNTCPSYGVLQYHLLSQNQPAMHFAGTTGVAGHNDFVLLQNPNFFPAGVTLRFANSAGAVITQSFSMASNSRQTVHVGSAGHANVEQAVTVVPQTPYLPIWAEHADY